MFFLTLAVLNVLYRTQDDDDPFIKGEFDVIKELLEKVPEAKDGKQKVIL